MIPDAGRGLFASVDFKPGDIVSVSPVVIMEKSQAIAASIDSLLLNYCISEEGFEYVLIPLGLGAIANDGGGNIAANGDVGVHDAGVRNANAKLEWYFFSPDTHGDNSTTLAKSIKELAEAPFAQLDLAYIATEVIAKGQEITIDYGPEWRARWLSYLAALQSWEEEQSESSSSVSSSSSSSSSSSLFLSSGPRPQFRYSLASNRLNPASSTTLVASLSRASPTFNLYPYLPRCRYPVGSPMGLIPDHWKHRPYDLTLELLDHGVTELLDESNNEHVSQLVLCCAVLCCAVLRCAALCCAMLCCIVLYCNMLC